MSQDHAITLRPGNKNETQSQKKKEKKNEQSLRAVWDIIKYTDMCVMGVTKIKIAEEKAEKFRRNNS